MVSLLATRHHTSLSGGGHPAELTTGPKMLCRGLHRYSFPLSFHSEKGFGQGSCGDWTRHWSFIGLEVHWSYGTAASRG